MCPYGGEERQSGSGYERLHRDARINDRQGTRSLRGKERRLSTGPTTSPLYDCTKTSRGFLILRETGVKFEEKTRSCQLNAASFAKVSGLIRSFTSGIETHLASVLFWARRNGVDERRPERKPSLIPGYSKTSPEKFSRSGIGKFISRVIGR